MAAEKKTWTVIGFWYNDQIIVAGVVAGDHQVEAGDVSDVSEQGCWAASVEAETAEEAEELAVVPEEDEEEYTCANCGEVIPEGDGDAYAELCATCADEGEMQGDHYVPFAKGRAS